MHHGEKKEKKKRSLAINSSAIITLIILASDYMNDHLNYVGKKSENLFE
jgi:hypothetical protein